MDIEEIKSFSLVLIWVIHMHLNKMNTQSDPLPSPTITVATIRLPTPIENCPNNKIQNKMAKGNNDTNDSNNIKSEFSAVQA